METIKNYLETMFSQLPNTSEVIKAKNELGQIMEDKYQELLNEGKTENEAVGIVISEFGNLDELAEDLGIKSFINNSNLVDDNIIKSDEVKKYIKDTIRSGYMIGLGVLLCIISVCGPIITSEFYNDDAISGIVFMFITIAVAVGLFVFNGMEMSKWKHLSQNAYCIDFATAEYVHNQKESFRMIKAMMITIGVILCILSVVPIIIIDSFTYGKGSFAIGPVLMFVMIGIAVFLFVTAGVRDGAYDKILNLNKGGTMGANFVSSQKNKYTNKTVGEIMSVYWNIVTCIYLCWSFLTFKWHITWIVFVIAAVIENLINSIYKEK